MRASRGRVKTAARRVCVLASGGVDSAALILLYLSRGFEVQPLFVRCGLRWEAQELRALRRFLRSRSERRLKPLVVSRADVPGLPPGHWSRSGRVPAWATPDEDVYLPGRNVLLLTQAGLLCLLRGIPRIAWGILAGNPFPDATPRFRRRMESALSAGLGAKLSIEAPFSRCAKTDVLRRFPGLPLELTVSCMDPRSGRPCMRCSKCREREDALRAARA